MKAIILNDFYNWRRSIKTSIFALVCCMISPIISALRGQLNFGYVIMTIGIASFIFGSIEVSSVFYDEQSGFLDLIYATPISEKRYITSKFVFSVLIHLIIFLVASIVMLAISNDIELIKINFLIISIYMICCFVNIAFMFKFGCKNIFTLMMVVFMILFFTAYFFGFDNIFEFMKKDVKNTYYLVIGLVLLIDVVLFFVFKKLGIKYLKERKK